MIVRRIIIVCCVLLGGSGAQAQAAADLAKNALAMLEKNCYACHGQNGSAEGGMSFILQPKKLIERKKVVAGTPDKSRIYLRMTSRKNPMPPEGEEPTGERPTDEEVALIKEWIIAGAPAPVTPENAARPFESLHDVLQAIRSHLQKLNEADRPFQRYFTLTHLYNLKSVKEQDLRLYRAALAKLVNSLSWKAELVHPSPVDPQQSVMAVDLRDLDWDQGHLWQLILQEYPYALAYDRSPNDRATRELAREIYDITGTRVPMVRADWFVSTASRPPLYHALLKIPKTAGELEQQLKVNFQLNFRRDRLLRAGFTGSGVSAQNRVIERHPALYGAYWKSYDFKPNNERGNLYRYSLGPQFDGNPFNQQAFQHDGGEIIFHLPNHLQAYMLVDGKDRRIDAGPVEVVRDSKQTSGSPAIVNGLSCMACHAHGLVREFQDTVRTGTAAGGAARDKVDQLFPTAEKMAEAMDGDDKRYMTALQDVLVPVLCVGPDKGKDVRAFAEPIAPIARWYRLQDLGIGECAAELGMPDTALLKAAIQLNPRLRELGLGPLVDNNTIKREAWESLQNGPSVFQDTAVELEMGTAVTYPKKASFP